MLRYLLTYLLNWFNVMNRVRIDHYWWVYQVSTFKTKSYNAYKISIIIIHRWHGLCEHSMSNWRLWEYPDTYYTSICLILSYKLCISTVLVFVPKQCSLIQYRYFKFLAPAGFRKWVPIPHLAEYGSFGPLCLCVLPAQLRVLWTHSYATDLIIFWLIRFDWFAWNYRFIRSICNISFAI